MVDLGGPATGKVWDIRSVVLVDQAFPDVVIANTTPFVASAPSIGAVNPSRRRWVDSLAGTPWAEDFTLSLMILNPNHLIVGAAGATATTYVATAQVLERKAADFT